MSLGKEPWLNMLGITKTESIIFFISLLFLFLRKQVQIRQLGETLGKPNFIFFTDVFLCVSLICKPMMGVGNYDKTDSGKMSKLKYNKFLYTLCISF